jgi:UDP:flavonoid glycosyltransferase YjiC (YdhE family)
MRIRRILFAPLGHFLSHLSRCLAVADVLKERGHDIGFVCVPKDAAWLASLGYQVFPTQSLPAGDIMAYGAPFEYQQKYLGSKFSAISSRSFGIESMVKDDFAIYARFKPNLLVWAGHLTAPFTASLKGIAAVGIKNLSMPIDNQPACDASTDAQGRTTLELQLKKELKDFLAHATQESDQYLRYVRAIPWIVPGLPVLENKATLALLGTPVHHYVGQLHWRGWDAMPHPEADMYAHKTVILVTLGSTFPFAGIARHVLSAFADERFHVIVNTGDQFTISAPDAPGHHEVLPLICLRAYLQISHVVLHHGGHGTAMEVLNAGLPSVVIPFNGDQIDISLRLEQFGCALRIGKYPGDISAGEVAQALHKVLDDPSYRDNAQKFSQELARWPDGATMAADLIENHALQMQNFTNPTAATDCIRSANLVSRT